MNPLVDKYGIPIEEGDILKVYHFTGARRKKHYMYKMAVLWDGKMYGSHLNSVLGIKLDYPLWTAESDSEDYEIVQSKNWEKL